MNCDTARSAKFFCELRVRRILISCLFLVSVSASADAQAWNQVWSDEFNGTANSPISAA